MLVRVNYRLDRESIKTFRATFAQSAIGKGAPIER
jgi:hypothetical protein